MDLKETVLRGSANRTVAIYRASMSFGPDHAGRLAGDKPIAVTQVTASPCPNKKLALYYGH